MKDSIIVYSSPTCPMCRALKMQLAKANIDYHDEQTDYTPITERGITKLPVLQVGDQFLTMEEAVAWIKGR